MKSYFRFLGRHKSLTIIQMLGVSIALSFAIPATSLLVELLQMNRDNPEYKNIYGVTAYTTTSFEDEDRYFTETYPEVEKATMFISSGTGINKKILFDGIMLDARTMYANEDIVDFFPPEMESGSFEAISNANSIILSKSFASSLSSDNLLGSTVFIDDKPFVVSGILDGFRSKKIPDTDIILNLRQAYSRDLSFFTYTFVKFREGVDIESFKQKVLGNDRDMFIDKLNVRDEKYLRLGFTRYDKMSITEDFYWLNCMHPDAMVVIGLALLLLLLFAFSNYITLSMAMATRRAREMATKQLLGSSKAFVMRQMIAENIVFTAVCFILGLGMTTFSIKMLGGLLALDGKAGLMNTIQLTPLACASYLLLIVAIGTLTGIAPARVILRYSALDVVKGEFRAKEKGFMSKFVITVQGLITVGLLFVSIVQFSQIRHNSRLDFGCGIDDVFTVYLPNSDDDEKNLVLQALSQKSYTSSIGYADNIPGFLYSRKELSDMTVNLLVCDRGAFEALGFKIKEDYMTRGASVLWMTEALKERLEDEPIKEEDMHNLGVDVVGGTIETFHANTNRGSYFGIPAVAVKDADADIKKGYIVLKAAGRHSDIEKDVKATVDGLILGNSGRLKVSRCMYLRDFYNVSNLTELKSILDILKKYMMAMIMLSLLGILGISTYNMQIRRHDIAVRKVFGATTRGEASRNAARYASLMLIANAVGLPLGYLLANAMLESEVSKVSIGAWMFILTIVFTMAVTICVCFIQSYYTASLNPTESIKSE